MFILKIQSPQKWIPLHFPDQSMSMAWRLFDAVVQNCIHILLADIDRAGFNDNRFHPP